MGKVLDGDLRLVQDNIKKNIDVKKGLSVAWLKAREWTPN